MAAFLRYLRANPQVLALLIICLVLGIGTFLIVVFGLVSSGSQTTSGEPSGWRAPTQVLIASASPVGRRPRGCLGRGVRRWAVSTA